MNFRVLILNKHPENNSKQFNSPHLSDVLRADSFVDERADIESVCDLHLDVDAHPIAELTTTDCAVFCADGVDEVLVVLWTDHLSHSQAQGYDEVFGGVVVYHQRL